MIFAKKKMKQIDPAFCLAELRSEIERAVEESKACGVRSYLIEQALEDARTAVAIKRAACSPL
jgi:hypothetical protein